MDGQGSPLSDRAEGPWARDPRLHPRPGRAPDRGRPEHSLIPPSGGDRRPPTSIAHLIATTTPASTMASDSPPLTGDVQRPASLYSSTTAAPAATHATFDMPSTTTATITPALHATQLNP